jgi:hypothetical protein
MKPAASCTAAHERRTDVRDLISVRDALCARIRERRTSLRSALQVVGASLAEALAEAPCSTAGLFFDANERGRSDSHVLRILSRDLQLSPFIVLPGVRAEMSRSLRFHLRLHLRRLDALIQGLSSVEFQLAEMMSASTA